MIDDEYIKVMARYGAWQNESLAAAADGLTDAGRRLDRSGFFGSIFGTMNHLLWGDRVWLSRFAEVAGPRSETILGSVDETDDWSSYQAARTAQDTAILDWASVVQQSWLADDMSWFSSAAQREVTKSNAMLVMHFFNHATHHRGQIHAMLTAAGAKPHDTDLFLMA